MKQTGVFGKIFNFFWLILIAGLILAFIKINDIKDAGEFYKYLLAKSREISPCFSKIFEPNENCKLSLKVESLSKTEIVKEDKKKDDKTKNDSSKNKSETDSKVEIKEDLSKDIKKVEDIPKDNKLNGIRTLEGSIITKTSARNLLDNLNVVDKLEKVDYKRTDWKHWSPFDKKNKCWNTREQVLFNQAVSGSVVLLDKNKNITKNLDKACSIKEGKWIDPYSDEIITNPKEADVDHHIPLGRAAMSGGQNFDKKTKQKYANDLDLLVVTTAKQNRAKGAKGPSEWLPPNKDSHCEYAKLYVFVATKYSLSLTKEDKSALNKAINTCKF